jgi:(R)-2-hydroxyacyl-CoA dehydratese activating ATPase
MADMIFAGFDIGSRTIKFAAFQNDVLIETIVTDSGMDPQSKVNHIWQEFGKKVSAEKAQVISTGYGRNLVSFAHKIVSEIACHAKGVHYFFPEAKTIIDIGGQDSKAMLKDERGNVHDFVMNDKCAAGTGRFLEMAATIFSVPVSKLGEISKKSTTLLQMNSVCVVFAESEIISLISQQQSQADIIHAVHHSIAKRIKSMMAALSWEKPIVFTGGVAHNCGMIYALEERFASSLLVAENPSITGAVGAALFAQELVK